MKKRLQGLVAGLLIGIMVSTGITFAKTGTTSIEAVFRDIKLYVDGVKIEPKDANGNAVEPFVYNGTTYLPVRAVGEAVGKTVSWDGKTSSVYLGEKPGDVQYLIDECPPYNSHHCSTFNDGKSFLMGGNKYSKGFTMNNSGWSGSEVVFNLNAQYESITLDIGPVDGTSFGITNSRSSKGNTLVSFYVDDVLVEELLLKNNDLPKKLTIPVDYGMKFSITHDVRDGSVGVANLIGK